VALGPRFLCSPLISSEARNDAGAGERCSIKGHVRDAIDVNSDVSVTTTRLLYNGMSPTQESKLRDKNNLLHTHNFSDERRGDTCDAICLTYVTTRL
jgi:hypothetical protein